MAVANGMDGRKVEHVEPHGSDLRQARLGLAQGRAARGVHALRAREDLVPGAKMAPFAIEPEGELGGTDLQVVARIAPSH